MCKANRSYETPATLELARSLFDLDEDSGNLTRRTSSGGRLPGAVAGYVSDERGYRKVGMCDRRFWEHRVVYALHHGAWPSGVIDHIDGNKGNNRPCNLRDVSQSENLGCSRSRSDQTEWGRGISRRKSGKYTFRARVNGKLTTIHRASYDLEAVQQSSRSFYSGKGTLAPVEMRKHNE